MATDYGLDWTVRRSNPGGGEIFSTCPDRPWGPPSLLYNGYRVFPGSSKRPGRDADLSPRSSAEVWKKSRAIPLLSLKVPINARVWLASPPRGVWLGSQDRIYFTTHAWVDSGLWLHTRSSLTHWNPSPAGHGSHTRTCIGTFVACKKGEINLPTSRHYRFSVRLSPVT
jgi:hypothetical protein